MLHLWATTGSGLYPVCGATAAKGETATQAMYRDLCEGCLQYQFYKSLTVKRRIEEQRKRDG